MELSSNKCMSIEVILLSRTKHHRLAIECKQVVIDPTTNADVRLHHKLGECSTRYIGVLVGRSVLESYDTCSIRYIGNDVHCTVTMSVTNDLIVDELVEHLKLR